MDLQRHFGFQLQEIEAVRGHGPGLAILLVLLRNLIRIRIIHRDGLGQEEELHHIIQGEKRRGQGFGAGQRKGGQPFIKTVGGKVVAVPAVQIDAGLQLFVTQLEEDGQGLTQADLPDDIVCLQGFEECDLVGQVVRGQKPLAPAGQGAGQIDAERS